MRRFDDAVVVISGAASGIGRAISEAFYREGAILAALDVDEQSLAALRADLGKRVLPIRADVADEVDVAAAVSEVVSRHGRIDVVINNAGIAPTGMIGDTSTETWRRIMSIDLDGVFFVTRAALPHLIASGGNIINTASISGLAGDFAYSAYNAAKGGLVNLTRSVAIDYAVRGVRCNAIAPGPVRTPLIAQNFRAHPGIEDAFVGAIPMGRMAEPEDLAGPFLFLASDEARFVTGAVLPVDGGLAAWNGQPDARRFPRVT